MANGQLRVQCPRTQSECLREAEVHCKDQGGVHIVDMREKNELYGVEGHMEGTLLSEVIFVCGDDAPRDPIKLPPREEASKSSAAQAPKKRICVPGSTQRCVGPGACVGGQSCIPDGSAWSACECSVENRAGASPDEDRESGTSADSATDVNPATGANPATGDPATGDPATGVGAGTLSPSPDGPGAAKPDARKTDP